MNSRESELRVFDIDADVIRKRLIELGATHTGVLNFKRAVLDVRPINPNKWIRVRTDGANTTLAIKERISAKTDGTGEVEVTTSDYDTTLLLLKELGDYTPRSIQESTREQYFFDGAEVSIDIWPQIAPLLEIEADEQTIYRTADHLGIDKTLLTAMSVEDYYLDTLGIDVKITKLQF